LTRVINRCPSSECWGYSDGGDSSLYTNSNLSSRRLDGVIFFFSFLFLFVGF
jgi:hypothetical protein